MKQLRTLLVDDEPLALRRLILTLGKLDGVEVVGSTTSAYRAVEFIDDLLPDVVVLDIAMPCLNGFEVIQKIRPRKQLAVIFATASEGHAVQAFDVDAVDYLLKPVAPDRLRQALDRARAWLSGRHVHADTSAPERPDDYSAGEGSLWVHRHQEFVRIPMHEIVWIEAERDYVRVHAKYGGGLIRTTLTALLAELNPDSFVRVHRSAICRKSEIRGLQRRPTGALRLSLSNGDWAPVGRSYGGGLRTFLKQVQEYGRQG